MLREASLALTLALTALAGCLADPTSEGASASTADDPAARSPIAQRLGAVPEPENVTLTRGSLANGSAPAPGEPWWLATVQATPEGGLSAFWWTIPEGALVPDGWNEITGRDDTTVVLEVAPILPEGANVSAWGLLGFREASGVLEVDGGLLEVATTATYHTLGEPLREETRELRLEPLFLSFGREHEAGGRIAFVLTAVAATPADFGVAFRVMDHDPRYPDSDEEPVESAEAFLAARNGTAPLAPALASSRGFAMHAYGESTFMGLLPGAPTTIVQRVGDVEVEETGGAAHPGTAPARRVHAATTPTFDRGWGVAFSSYFGMGTGAARWAATIDAHGERGEGEGVTAEAFPSVFLPIPVFLYGSVSGLGVGEGEGGMAATFALDRVGLPGLYHGWSMGQAEFGATLEELFGVPSVKRMLFEDGMPVAATRDCDVVVEPMPGSTLVWRGLLPATP